MSEMMPPDMQAGGLPPELMAALGGGGQAPPSNVPGGLPPELMAVLGQGGGAPEQAPPEGAMHSGSVAPGDPVEHYQQALDHLEQGAKADNDDGRIQVVMKAMTQIQGLLAAGEKAVDGMLGGSMDPAAVRQMDAPNQAY